LMVFIWTNLLMFTLRFFAGPIVHRINPIGLLFVSAVFGAAGLWLLGQPFTNDVWPWVAAVTVYGIGKTFYWPTLLGVISERFPRGGALALGISGGIGKQVRAAIKANTTPEKMPRVLSDASDGTRDVEMKEGDETVKVPVMFVTQKTYDALAEQAKKENREPPKLLQTTLQGDLATL